MLAHYRALIALRHSHPLVVDGRFELLLPEHPALWAFERRGDGGHRLVVLANCSSEPVSVGAAGLADLAGLSDLVDPTAGAEAGAAILMATHPGRAGSDLLPWESRVYELGAPAG